MEIQKESIQKKLKQWSKDTVASYLTQVNDVGVNVATSFYNQSDLSRVEDCELMIIGINPGCGCIFSEWNLKDRITEDFLYYGNPCFEGKSDEEIIFEYYEKYDSQKRKYGWDLMKKIHKMLVYSGKGDIIKQLDKFVLTNMVFFGTDEQKQIPKDINQDVCAKQTLELIDILNPKVILLLGDQSKDLFEKAAKNYHIHMESLAPNYHVFYSFYKGRHVIATYHTAYFRFYTNENMKIIGNIIGYALDNPSQKIDKKQFESFLIEKTNRYGNNSNDEKKGILEKGKSIRVRLKLFKENIDPNGADKCKLAYRGGLLNYEFYTIRYPNGKYIYSKDTIAIDLLIDDNEFLIRLGTRRNTSEKSKEIAIAIDGEFRPGNTTLTAPHWHIYKKMPLSTSDDEMIHIMNELLGKIKTFRDKEFPLNK